MILILWIYTTSGGKPMTYMDYMDPMSAVPKKAIKLKHSLTGWKPLCCILCDAACIAGIRNWGSSEGLQITYHFNPLHAKLSEGTWNMYLHFMSLLHIDMTQVVEILPHVRQRPTYSTESISWLLMTWLLASPGHQQLCWTGLTRSSHFKG